MSNPWNELDAPWRLGKTKKIGGSKCIVCDLPDRIQTISCVHSADLAARIVADHNRNLTPATDTEGSEMSDDKRQYAEHDLYRRVEIVMGPFYEHEDAYWLVRKKGGELRLTGAWLLTFEPYCEQFYNINPSSLSVVGSATRQEADDNANVDRIAVLRTWQQVKDGPWECELIKVPTHSSDGDAS